MMKKTTAFVLLALFGVACLQDVQAQGAQIDLGPRIGIDIGDIEEFFVGADARIGVVALPVLLNPALDYYFTQENLSFLQLSINALYEFGIANQVFTPYAGAGIGISRISVDTDGGPLEEFSDTETGINLIGGATFSAGNLRPFAQAQITFGDVELITLGGGLLFRIGGR